jgi:hypothetical protein
MEMATRVEKQQTKCLNPYNFSLNANIPIDKSVVTAQITSAKSYLRVYDSPNALG